MMKWSKTTCFLSLFISLLGLSACGTDLNNGDSKIQFTDSIAAEPIPSRREPTREEMVQGVTSALETIQSLYTKMEENAEKEGASSKGIKAVKDVQEKYKNRIAEIAKMDFNSLSLDELKNINSELGEIVSAIREAMDTL